MKEYTFYTIRNKTDDSVLYVGQTTSYKSRQYTHKYQAKKRSTPIGRYLTDNAIEYYYLVETVEVTTQGKANEIERQLIAEHSPAGNVQIGGSGEGKGDHNKITNSQIIEIAKDDRTIKEIADTYGVSYSYVHQIKSGEQCRDITDAIDIIPPKLEQKIKILDSDLSNIINDTRSSRIIAEDYGVSAPYIRAIKCGMVRSQPLVDIEETE